MLLLFVRQRDVEALEIELETGLAHQLTHRVGPSHPEPRWFETTLVELPLHVAVGMDTCGLREDVLTNNRLVDGYPTPGEDLHKLAGRDQRPLVDARPKLPVIAERHHDLIQGRVAGPLAHAVHGAVHALCS